MATTAITGPGGASKIIAINKPITAQSKPTIPAITNTFCNLSERSRAVEAGGNEHGNH